MFSQVLNLICDNMFCESNCVIFIFKPNFIDIYIMLNENKNMVVVCGFHGPFILYRISLISECD